MTYFSETYVGMRRNHEPVSWYWHVIGIGRNLGIPISTSALDPFGWSGAFYFGRNKDSAGEDLKRASGDPRQRGNALL